MRQTVSPTNTTREVQDNPLGVLAEAMFGGGSSNAIERMEARGQQELAKSDVLPTKGLENPAFAAMGIVIGEPVQGDKLFTVVTLPPGWTKKPTDHSMWNELRDDKNRVRATFFYKAAFYDRDAFIRTSARYNARAESSDDKTIRALVTDGDTVLFAGEPLPYGKGEYGNYDVAQSQATAWINERFPKWKDDTAYWD